MVLKLGQYMDITKPSSLATAPLQYEVEREKAPPRRKQRAAGTAFTFVRGQDSLTDPNNVNFLRGVRFMGTASA